MEKWKAVQKKWVWQTTVDRNIGGHTARIPDSYTFYKGSGPRGIGVDLSSKELIDKLAESIIPRSTTSRRTKIHERLEERWNYHHGGGKYTSKSEEVSRPSSAPSNPVRSLFDKSLLKQETLQELISQLKVAVDNPAQQLELIDEDVKQGGGEKRRVRGAQTRTTRLWQRKVEHIIKNKPTTDFGQNILEEKKGQTDDKKNHCSRKPSKGRQPSKVHHEGKRRRSGKKTSPTTNSPDSGFQSETSLLTKNSNLSSPAKSPENRPFTKAVSNLLTSDTLTGLLKQCEQNNANNNEENTSTDTNQTLLALLQEAQDMETNPLMKKAYQVTSVVTELRRDKFIMSLSNNYEMPQIPKHGQSFSRRRTKGQMYKTLEPISYSEVYMKSSTSHPILNKNKTMTLLSGFF